MPWTGKELVRLMEKNGWVVDRINGSHHIMEKAGFREVSIPVHGNRDIQDHFAKKLLKQAGLREKF
jgi:predicted RNA binding protein YcfA (HicA-like mRNA interferase family)